MIKEIINLLRANDFLIETTENIEFAKGEKELSKGLKKNYKKLKRKWQLKK